MEEITTNIAEEPITKDLVWNLDYEFNGEQQSKTKYVIYKIENTET